MIGRISRSERILTNHRAGAKASKVFEVPSSSGILSYGGCWEGILSLRGRFNYFMAQETVQEVMRSQKTKKASMFVQFIVFSCYFLVV